MTASPAPDFTDSALLIVGHGSAKNRHSSAPTRALAEEMAARGSFAEVAASFFKEEPGIDGALDRLSAKTVYVVPNFAGAGYFSCQAIPERLGLSGRYTTRADGRRVVLCDPVGTHPRIAEIVFERARDVVRDNALACEDVCLILAGHGSKRPGGSSRSAELMKETLQGMGACGEVVTAFLEQEPLIADWPRLTDKPAVIVMPLLIAEGLHGSEDLPPLFGLTPESLRDAPHTVGPATAHGRTVYYCKGIGAIAEVADIVLELVEEG